jgi:hypothetical protein
MVIHDCNPCTQEVETDVSQVQGQPGLIARPCLKENKNKVRHQWLMTAILAIWKAEIRRIMVPIQPRQKIS